MNTNKGLDGFKCDENLEITDEMIESGLKVLVVVTVEFHEIYGFSLNIRDIDPTYTLGDQAKKRQEIIKQLEEDGVMKMNKEIETLKKLVEDLTKSNG